jgi:hypothetical protein
MLRATLLKPAGSATPDGLSNTNAAIQTLTTYIPTEVLTLYVSALAALGPITIKVGNVVHQIGRWAPFWTLSYPDTVITWVVFATKIKAAGKAIPASPRKWPL